MTTRTVDFDQVLEEVRRSPADVGSIDLISIRPAELERKVMDEVKASFKYGIEGDDWLARTGGRNLETQVTIMNSRFSAAVTPEGRGWEIAGDQLYVDYDISEDNLPQGTRIKTGEAVLEISSEPHAGCAKFSERFGRDVLMGTRTGQGKALRLRGVHAFVIQEGVIATEDTISKL